MVLTRRILVLAFAGTSLAGAARAQSKPAIGGYDTVAYFTIGKPQPGNPTIAHEWDGRRYLFASEQHRQLFAANPDKYAPQFAGNCAAGLAAGHKVEADPTNWLISDGRLFLFFSSTGHDRMRADPAMAGRADSGWQKLK